MGFQVSGLEYGQFAALFEMNDRQLAERNAVRKIVDANPGFPCRVSLQDAQPGETVILVNYEHLAVASPYRSGHAVYVREKAEQAQPQINEVPEVLRTRLLSLRAYDDQGMMIEADVIPGRDVEALIEHLFANPRTQFIHAHNARPGCFAARIDRAA